MCTMSSHSQTRNTKIKGTTLLQKKIGDQFWHIFLKYLKPLAHQIIAKLRRRRLALPDATYVYSRRWLQQTKGPWLSTSIYRFSSRKQQEAAGKRCQLLIFTLLLLTDSITRFWSKNKPYLKLDNKIQQWTYYCTSPYGQTTETSTSSHNLVIHVG